MAYDGYDGYDGFESSDYELNGKHAVVREAASADEKRDERHNAAAVRAGERERDAAEWSEGAPGCLAAVMFAQRMQRKREARVQLDHGDGDNGDSSSSAVVVGHAGEDGKE